jgi:hypothetical protein
MSATSTLWTLIFGFKPEHVEAAAAGDVTVKASSGQVAAIRAGAGLVSSINLKDGATEVWQLAPDTRDLFGVPLNFGESIVINFPAAGEAWIVYT